MAFQHPDAVTAAGAIPLDQIWLADWRIWARQLDRYELFRRLRAERPVSWHAEVTFEGFPPGPGYWSVVRYDDVRAVSRDNETFCNGQGYLIPDLPTELGEFYGSMLHMDAPRHTRMRLIVNRSFTPRHVARIEQYVDEKAAAIVDRALQLGEFDFVEEIAAALPLEIICEMMGIPESLWPTVLRCTNVILGATDAEYASGFDDLLNVSLEINALAEEIARDRLANPGDDLTSALMHAEVDGHRLTPAEYASFFILLVVAGNETTRNATTHGMWQLAFDPAQRARWRDDLDRWTPTAIEEIVRHSSPVQHFRRTATRDTEIAGQPVKAGDKVVLWFGSANRDERVFPDAGRFDITRSPNDHVGFGAGGPHFCLGANLARRELRSIFTQLLTRLDGLQVTGEPDYLQSAFINGIKHLPCRVR
jgi:cytochrome P450